MKNLVLVGGGTGSSELLPELAKARGVKTTAIVSVFDSGGSTGQLRSKFKISAVGDLRKACSAVSPPLVSAVLEKRLKNNHAVGNLALAFLTQQYGFQAATEIYNKLAQTSIAVLPVSFATADLVVQLANGEQLVGEASLDHPPRRLAQQKVVDLKLTKKVALNPAAKKALQQADLIVVGPGSLLGSLLPHFLVDGFAAAFERSEAQKIFVAPATQEFGYHGETAEEQAERFPVGFDEVLETQRRRWRPKDLARELLKSTR